MYSYWKGYLRVLFVAYGIFGGGFAARAQVILAPSSKEVPQAVAQPGRASRVKSTPQVPTNQAPAGPQVPPVMRVTYMGKFLSPSVTERGPVAPNVEALKGSLPVSKGATAMEVASPDQHQQGPVGVMAASKPTERGPNFWRRLGRLSPFRRSGNTKDSGGSASGAVVITLSDTTLVDTVGVEREAGRIGVGQKIALGDSLYAVLLADSVRMLSLRVGRLRAEVQRAQGTSSARQLEGMFRDIPCILPLRYRYSTEVRISSGFGPRFHPLKGYYHIHQGIDLPQPLYSPVYATADGWVERVVFQPSGIGLAVYVRHATGYTSVYGHLSAHALYVGSYVLRGELLGHVGQSGSASGPHLHYMVLYRGVAVDPYDYCYLLASALGG